MKAFPLSTPSERIASISFSAVVIACFGVLIYALRSNTGLMIATGLGALLISVILVIYVVNVLKAACIVHGETKTVEVKGPANFTADVSKAVLLQTLPRKNGQATMRYLVFSDEKEQIVATIPTMFTFKQGKMAEPMAEELAKELGIPFQRNIPEWEFDRKLYQEHQKQAEAEAKAAAKERRKAVREYRMNKLKNRK